jgi:hypothetical protein
MGRLAAVCTRDTSKGERSTSSHCAPTVCIQVPTFEVNWAIQSARKIGYRRIGVHADVAVTPRAVTEPSGRNGQPQQPGRVVPQDPALVGLVEPEREDGLQRRAVTEFERVVGAQQHVVGADVLDETAQQHR